jgi:hypothetical protein
LSHHAIPGAEAVLGTIRFLQGPEPCQSMHRSDLCKNISDKDREATVDQRPGYSRLKSTVAMSGCQEIHGTGLLMRVLLQCPYFQAPVYNGGLVLMVIGPRVEMTLTGASGHDASFGVNNSAGCSI